MNDTAAKVMLATAITVAAFATGCQQKNEHPTPVVSEAVSVTTEVISAMPLAERYEAIGTVSPKVSSVLSSQTMGRVLAVHVREGDRVRAGQVLVEIDARNAAAQASKAGAGRVEVERSLEEVDRSIASAEQSLVAAEAQARLAKVTYDRFAHLLERRAVSRQEFDEAEARDRVAAAQVESARSSVEAMRARRRAVEARVEQAGADIRAASVVMTYAKVTAPFAGIVTRRSVEVGTMATPGTSLLTIEDERIYRLDASVQETFAGRVNVGDVVPVTLAGLGELRLQGRVGEIAPSADPASRSVTVKIDLPVTRGLRSGMYGRAEFPRGERRALTVPKAALVERGQIVSVYVVDGHGEAHLRVVTLGKESGERVEVLSGLAEGDRVVIDGAGRLADGRTIAEGPR
jgi:multidrug efflux system membrane fusion protein